MQGPLRQGICDPERTGLGADHAAAALAAGGHIEAQHGAGAADLLVESAARLHQAHSRLGQLPERALGQCRLARVRHALGLPVHAPPHRQREAR